MSNHLINRPARLIPCHGCARHVLAAIDTGITIAADPAPIDINTEIAAWISGRFAYDIVIVDYRVYLVYRNTFRIGAPRKYAVVTDHQCPARAQPQYRLIPPKPAPGKKKTPVRKVKQAVLEEVPF